MRGLSHRSGGRDDRVTRCTCGAWQYEGHTCSTCAALMRGETHARRTATNGSTEPTHEDMP